MTQKQIIQQYLKSQGGWVKAGGVRSIKTEWGLIGYRGDRDLREMYETPEECEKWGIEQSERDTKFSWVRYIGHRKAVIAGNIVPVFAPKKIEKKKEMLWD